MSFLDTFIKKHSRKGLSFSEPIFIKESSSIPKQIEALKQLKKTATAEQLEKIEVDIKMLYSGYNGEKTVAYELKNSALPIFVLQDLCLKCGELTAQIDFVVLSQAFLLVIECKKLLDDIEITGKGDFNRCFKTPTGLVYKKEGMYNPVTQNQRHVELIKKILCKNDSVFENSKYSGFLRQIVVLANEKTVIRDSEAPEQIKNSIIKCDQLIGFIRNLMDNSLAIKLSEQEMRKISDLLIENNRENPEEYTKEYTPAVPICPHCKVQMVIRTAKKGVNIGNEFYGCPNYPRCKQTVNIKTI